MGTEGTDPPPNVSYSLPMLINVTDNAHGNNASVIGNATPTQQGKFGKAMKFDGEAQYVSLESMDF